MCIHSGFAVSRGLTCTPWARSKMADLSKASRGRQMGTPSRIETSDMPLFVRNGMKRNAVEEAREGCERAEAHGKIDRFAVALGLCIWDESIVEPPKSVFELQTIVDSTTTMESNPLAT